MPIVDGCCAYALIIGFGAPESRSKTYGSGPKDLALRSPISSRWTEFLRVRRAAVSLPSTLIPLVTDSSFAYGRISARRHYELRLNGRLRLTPSAHERPDVPAIGAGLELVLSPAEAPAPPNHDLRLRAVGAEYQR